MRRFPLPQTRSPAFGRYMIRRLGRNLPTPSLCVVPAAQSDPDGLVAHGVTASVTSFPAVRTEEGHYTGRIELPPNCGLTGFSVADDVLTRLWSATQGHVRNTMRFISPRNSPELWSFYIKGSERAQERSCPRQMVNPGPVDQMTRPVSLFVMDLRPASPVIPERKRRSGLRATGEAISLGSSFVRRSSDRLPREVSQPG